MFFTILHNFKLHNLISLNFFIFKINKYKNRRTRFQKLYTVKSIVSNLIIVLIKNNDIFRRSSGDSHQIKFDIIDLKVKKSVTKKVRFHCKIHAHYVRRFNHVSHEMTFDFSLVIILSGIIKLLTFKRIRNSNNVTDRQSGTFNAM